jgi:serine/threonine protein phosphatase PrpC
MFNGHNPHLFLRLPSDQTYLSYLLLLRRSAATLIQKWYRKHKHRHNAEFDSLLSSLCRIRTLASICVQKHVKGFLVRKSLAFLRGHDPKKLIRWMHDARSVYIIANFTDPPWKELIQLRFCKALKEFISTVLGDRKVQKGTYGIKFLVDGKWMCDGNLAISQDLGGNFNNVIMVNDQRNSIPRAISVRSFQSTATELNGSIRTQTSCSPIVLVRSISGNLESPRGFGVVNEDKVKEPVRLAMAGHMFAKPASRHCQLRSSGSADAWFTDPEKQVFGVADGVSEWSTFGLDPSKYPTELIQHCRQLFYTVDEAEQDSTDLLERVVLEATEQTRSYGSSTLLLAVCRNSLLYTFCLGDSSFIVLRKREESNALATVYRSLEQQHSFNCPFQLANLPKPSAFEEMSRKGLGTLVTMLRKSSKYMNDSPFDADNEMIPLKVGDIIIAGSDGLFDNLYDQEIIKIAESVGEGRKEPQEMARQLAQVLAEKAIDRGWDTNYRSPFARNAGKAGKKYMGGKLDDTTVIVAIGV